MIVDALDDNDQFQRLSGESGVTAAEKLGDILSAEQSRI
jgi:hypothetical protein